MMLIIGLIMLIVMGILVKLFDERIRQRKAYKQGIVCMFFAGIIFCLIGLVQLIMQVG